MSSNYRYNPFNDASDYVSCVERRIIPLVSPFEIVLQEVPEKADPSNVSIYEITIGDGDVVLGQKFIEVAATPTQGQFWMDYNTGADGDENWNTGRIQFSSADAGKIVEISYTGTGTLATIKGNSDPYWFYDYGDGSDGHIFISEDTTLLKNTVNCKSLIIKEGFKIVPATPIVPLIIKSQGVVVINGTIDADYYGNVLNSTNSNGGGAGGTGYGASSFLGGGYVCFNGQYIQLNDDTIDYMARSGMAGGGAGGGSDGAFTSYAGGAVRIAAPEIILSGIITANGIDGYYQSTGGRGRGGGGGGTVCIACNHIVNTGTISVRGGAYAHVRATAGSDGWYRIFELGGN